MDYLVIGWVGISHIFLVKTMMLKIVNLGGRRTTSTEKWHSCISSLWTRNELMCCSLLFVLGPCDTLHLRAWMRVRVRVKFLRLLSSFTLQINLKESTSQEIVSARYTPEYTYLYLLLIWTPWPGCNSRKYWSVICHFPFIQGWWFAWFVLQHCPAQKQNETVLSRSETQDSDEISRDGILLGAKNLFKMPVSRWLWPKLWGSTSSSLDAFFKFSHFSVKGMCAQAWVERYCIFLFRGSWSAFSLCFGLSRRALWSDWYYGWVLKRTNDEDSRSDWGFTIECRCHQSFGPPLWSDNVWGPLTQSVITLYTSLHSPG